MMNQFERGGHIEPHLTEEHVLRLPEELPRQRSTCIGDDQSNVKIVRRHTDWRQNIDRGEIDDNDAIVDAVLCLKLAADLLQQRPAAGYEYHVEPASGELVGKRLTDARGGTGDQGPGTETLGVEADGL